MLRVCSSNTHGSSILTFCMTGSRREDLLLCRINEAVID